MSDDLVALQARLPLVTASLPGVLGVMKQAIEDFEVEEIPAYTPSGAGEHLFLWLEKRGLDARGMVRAVARALEIPEGDVGTAGMKDTQAVTRQFVSVPARAEALVSRIDGPSLRVLEAARHDNKLKTGHLLGNRFRIVLRDVHPDAAERASRILAHLDEVGLVNYFGPQRFGREGATLLTGLDLLAGRAPRLSPFLLRLALSAVQSALFNAWAAERVSAGQLDEVQAGEVMLVAESGGPFWCDDPVRDRERYRAREVVPSGPMYGPKMRFGRGLIGRTEQELLVRYGASLASFARFGKLSPGTRRPLVVWPKELTAASEDNALLLSFTLPAGSYATVLLRELMKSPAAPLAGEDEDES